MSRTSRSEIDLFDLKFRNLHDELKTLVLTAGEANLFRRVEESGESMMPLTVGTFAIRSAAAVEQMINGITVRLWDDPFEWTLPEQFPTAQDLVEYFNEVEAARQRGFKFLKNDDDLQKEIPAPAELRNLEQILTDTLNRSQRLLSKAKTFLSEFITSNAKRQ